MESVCYICLAVIVGVCASSLPEEKCTKFEYEYKVLERIVELEHEHKEMKKMADKIQQLQDVNHETAKILESQTEIIDRLTESSNQQVNLITALQRKHESDIDAVKKVAESTVNRQDAETTEIIRKHSSDIDEVKKYGETSINGQNKIIQELKSEIDELEKLKESTGGSKSTYTRWGRHDCPSNGTELVYDGYIGGSWYKHHGGAANYVCLTKQPLWGHVQSGRQNNAYMYGTEFEFSHHKGNGKDFFGRDLKDLEAPCAVCRTKRPISIMIPGRNKCLDGWTLEYHGYLAANHYNHYVPSEYTCVDHSLTTVPQASRGNQDGALLYLVEAICGSLKCPPYVDGAELTCVVCSK